MVKGSSRKGAFEDQSDQHALATQEATVLVMEIENYEAT